MPSIRKLAILLLDSQDGITEEAWDELVNHLDAEKDKDIFDAVKAVNGMRYLPEDHGLEY